MYIWARAGRKVRYMDEVKSVQKSIRMTPRVYKCVDEYRRGEGFNEKLANLVTDYLEHRDELRADWERLQAAVNDKHAELKAVQDKLRKVREVDARLAPLVTALLDLLGEEC